MRSDCTRLRYLAAAVPCLAACAAPAPGVGPDAGGRDPAGEHVGGEAGAEAEAEAEAGAEAEAEGEAGEEAEAEGAGPASCVTPADCREPDACPPDAPMGCDCREQSGRLACVALCAGDDDCPAADPPLTCARDRSCRPPREGGDGGEWERWPCETQADCEGPAACPRDPQGCACRKTPDGLRCLPLCVIDEDCPGQPGSPLACGPDGVCAPPGDPGESESEGEAPAGCDDDADCEGACPAGARGCACSDTPGGRACLPTCAAAEDCPARDDGRDATCSADGRCRPAGG